MDKSKLRPGQRAALDIIIERVTTGHPYTTIVLPTRYGKSDVMRLAAIELQKEGAIYTTLILSPNRILRNQIVDRQKLHPFMTRYSIWNELKVLSVDKPGLQFGRNGETILSATLQLVQRNTDLFCMWVESVCATTGKPPLIIVDEAHTGSEDNTWGGTIQELVQAGARAVLLTATAYRSDGKIIPGFGCDILGEEQVITQIRRPGETPEMIIIEEYSATRRRIKLRPHHETTFADAWAEIPSSLCKISRLPFDVDLSRIEKGQTAGVMLSSLKDYEIRRSGILHKVTRDRSVIQDGCERLVRALHYFRHNTHDCGAIIFCGNDDEPERKANQHAKLIRDVLLMIDPQLDIVIATSATDDEEEAEATGNDRIEAFKKGKGDILIAKQMASVGLDIERLKVGLDLSSIRSIASVIQRMMRIATIYGAIRHCVWITPDDSIGRGIFNYVVSDSGGAEWRTTLNELIGSHEIPKGPEPKDKTIFNVNGTADSRFEDNQRNYAEPEQLPGVEALLDTYPELTSMLSHSEIANRFVRHGINVSVPAKPAIRDIAAENKSTRDKINELAGGIAYIKIGGFDRQLWGPTLRDIFVSAYRSADVPLGTKLDQITDQTMLKHIRHALERTLESLTDE